MEIFARPQINITKHFQNRTAIEREISECKILLIIKIGVLPQYPFNPLIKSWFGGSGITTIEYPFKQEITVKSAGHCKMDGEIGERTYIKNFYVKNVNKKVYT